MVKSEYLIPVTFQDRLWSRTLKGPDIERLLTDLLHTFGYLMGE